MNTETALVTEASSGIGEATAARLAKAGYRVYGTSRRGARAGNRPFPMLPLDVTRDDSVEAAVREVMRLEGCMDLLVNNAGSSIAPAGAEESSVEQARAPHSGRGRVDQVAKCAEVLCARPRGDQT